MLADLSEPCSASTGSADRAAPPSPDGGRHRIPRNNDRRSSKDLAGASSSASKTGVFPLQLAVLCESLSGQLPAGWDVTVVVCNDHADLSPELRRLLEVYGLPALTGVNHAHSHDIDFSTGRGGYAMLNKVEALQAISAYLKQTISSA